MVVLQLLVLWLSSGERDNGQCSLWDFTWLFLPKIQPPDKSCASVHREVVTKTLITHPKPSDRDCQDGASVIELEGRNLKQESDRRDTHLFLFFTALQACFPLCVPLTRQCWNPTVTPLLKENNPVTLGRGT